jgi:uncharacterized protein (DUF885 family)
MLPAGALCWRVPLHLQTTTFQTADGIPEPHRAARGTTYWLKSYQCRIVHEAVPGTRCKMECYLSLKSLPHLRRGGCGNC